MSYDVTTTGQITITPPLTWREIQASPLYSTNSYDNDLVITEHVVGVDDGPLTVKTAAAIDTRNTWQLADRINAAITAAPGHTWTGHITCQGEEVGDLWRIAIIDGCAGEIRPIITWPGQDA